MLVIIKPRTKLSAFSAETQRSPRKELFVGRVEGLGNRSFWRHPILFLPREKVRKKYPLTYAGKSDLMRKKRKAYVPAIHVVNMEYGRADQVSGQELLHERDQ